MDYSVKPDAGFSTTRWSVVLRTRGEGPEAEQALDILCRRYWLPLYSYARRWGRSASDAEDCVQGFFGMALERTLFETADPQRGRLRTFLLTAFQHYLRDQHAYDTAAKRGGDAPQPSFDFHAAESRYGIEPVDHQTPAQVFERKWALSVLDQALDRLRAAYIASDKQHVFDALRHVLEDPHATPDHAAAADRLGMTQGAVRVAIHRLRQRFGDRLRDVIRETLCGNEAVDAELRYLQSVLRRPR